jgi:corticotropin releasing hormone receptor 1
LVENENILISGNASRGCSLSGEWDSRTDYNNCRAIEIPAIPKPSEDFSVSIYFVGYILSLLALTLALVFFLSFRFVSNENY